MNNISKTYRVEDLPIMGVNKTNQINSSNNRINSKVDYLDKLYSKINRIRICSLDLEVRINSNYLK